MLFFFFEIRTVKSLITQFLHENVLENGHCTQITGSHREKKGDTKYGELSWKIITKWRRDLTAGKKEQGEWMDGCLASWIDKRGFEHNTRPPLPTIPNTMVVIANQKNEQGYPIVGGIRK